MRIVSALYNEFFPIAQLYAKDVQDCVVARDLSFKLLPDDLLLLWGGADICASYYGQANVYSGNWGAQPSHRDMFEWAMLQQAKDVGCRVFGICRGMQMMTAFTGGYLLQHVNAHAGKDHWVTVNNPDTRFRVNSYHHQMCVPESGAKILATAAPGITTQQYGERQLERSEFKLEVEAASWYDGRWLGVQWHPEWMDINSEATRQVKVWLQI